MQWVSWVRYAIVLCVLFVNCLAARAAPWAPNEQQVSPETNLIDPEFSLSRGMVAWMDEVGKVWLAHVDPDTGLFRPADGRGILVDTGAATIGSSPFAFNGPEWVLSAGGDQLTYTRYLQGKPQTSRASRVAVARQRANGSWQATLLLPNEPRYIPYGSENPRDSTPFITYLDPQGNHYWRGIRPGDIEQQIVGAIAPFIPIRQVRGAVGSKVVFSQSDGEWMQVYRYDLEQQRREQLTFGPGNKTRPWMWRAPEFDNEFVLSVFVDNVLNILRALPQADDTVSWQSVLEIKPPEGRTILSPEPMTYDGASYIFMGMALSVGAHSSEIWIAGIDPRAPLLRRITDDTEPRARVDPEFFITSQGLRIYYNRYRLTDDPEPVACFARECSEGVWMADPGLETAR